jgi:predicted alpha/beta superfamily hydrolase
MDIKKILVSIFLSLLPFLTVAASETSDFTLSKIHVMPIRDTQSDRQYELYIKLPEGYAENKDKTYPAIYFTDAMWHVEILSGTVAYVLEDAILVGISWQKDGKEESKKTVGEHVSRFRDYTLTKSNNPKDQAKYQPGQASNHLTFIRNDVIKAVENNYRTDATKRTYFGYSLGGSFGAYILLTQPDTFKNYVLGSPALNKEIFALEANTVKNRSNLNANVFVSVGALEKSYIGPTKEFISLLKSRNYENLSLHHEVIESADHGRAFPKTAIRSLYWLSELKKDRTNIN